MQVLTPIKLLGMEKWLCKIIRVQWCDEIGTFSIRAARASAWCADARQVFQALMMVPPAVMFLGSPNGSLLTSENIKRCCCCCFEFQPSLLFRTGCHRAAAEESISKEPSCAAGRRGSGCLGQIQREAKQAVSMLVACRLQQCLV